MLRDGRTNWLLVLVAAAVASRWIPHPPNFTPVIGLALFSGARFDNRKLAVFVPLLAMALSDLVLGFHSTLWSVYGALAVISVAGFMSLKNFSAIRVGVMSVTASGFFFLVTNFGVWVSEHLYPQTWAGLVESYVAGIPFFPATLVSSLVYSYGLFAAYALGTRYLLRVQRVSES